MRRIRSYRRLARGCDPDRERGARDRLGYERDHDQRSHRLLPARPAARPQVLEAQPQQGRLQDLPGRHHDRHQRRCRRSRRDRRRLPRPPADRRTLRLGLLPDRRIRDLHRHQQVQHPLQPDRSPGPGDLRGQRQGMEPGPWRLGLRADRLDQPHLHGRRADQLQDAVPQQQERCLDRRGRALRGAARAAGRQHPQRDRLPLQLPRRPGHRQPGRLQRRRLHARQRSLRAVHRHRALLRGDQRRSHRCFRQVHLLDQDQQGSSQDHLDQWVPLKASAKEGNRPPVYATPGPTTAPSVRSARCRCSSASS